MICACGFPHLKVKYFKLGVKTSMPIHAYLNIKGKQTGSIPEASEAKGGIRVYKIDHNLLWPIDVETGEPTGRRHHLPLRICKKIDGSSPLLYRALTSAELLECDLKLYHWEKGVETHYYTIKLNNSKITEIRIFEAIAVDPDHEELDPMEEVSFSYDNIVWRHEPTGREHEDAWGHET